MPRLCGSGRALCAAVRRSVRRSGNTVTHAGNILAHAGNGIAGIQEQGGTGKRDQLEGQALLTIVHTHSPI